MGSCLCFIPIGFVLLLNILFITTYFIALGENHINPFYAYISDTGTLPPEMCFFTLGLNAAMVLAFAFAYIRYLQIKDFLDNYCNPLKIGATNTLNSIGFYMGITAAMGLGVVGAFQESNFIVIHIIGAAMAFGIGSVYTIFQGILTNKMAAVALASKRMAYLRVGMGTFCILLYLICQGTGVISLAAFKDELEQKEKNVWEKKILKWEEKHGPTQWPFRITSVVAEWILLVFLEASYLLFIPDFKQMAFIPARVELRIKTTARTSNRVTINIASDLAEEDDFGLFKDENYTKLPRKSSSKKLDSGAEGSGSRKK